MRYGDFLRVDEILNGSQYPINSMAGCFALHDVTISHYLLATL